MLRIHYHFYSLYGDIMLLGNTVRKIFGFKLPEDKTKGTDSFVIPKENDGATNIERYSHGVGDFFGQYIDFDDSVRNEVEQINKYRNMALQAECESAIEDIVCQAIVTQDAKNAVDIDLSNLDLSEKVKDAIRDEFNHILNMLSFNKLGPQLFRQWYIDGRLYFHKILYAGEAEKKGLKELRPIDPRRIRKIREIIKEQKDGIDIIKEIREYYIYNDCLFNTPSDNNMAPNIYSKAINIEKDSICHIHSGLCDPFKGTTLSFLHKAIKPLNQLRMMEDAAVIYRLVRAPERRMFYIDVGNLPKAKAEQYLQDIMNKYKNRMVYDAKTGEVKDDRAHMHMLEDFWIPRRDGGRGTEISTLPGGQSFDNIEELRFYQRRLYKSLNVPVSRLESDASFQLGRSSEITRDELKFDKFIARLRLLFDELFNDLLRTQLILKKVITSEEWTQFVNKINYKYQRDSHFSEIKELEMMEMRLSLVREASNYLGRYFSHNEIRTKIIRQTEEDIKRINEEIRTEIALPETDPHHFDPTKSGRY